MMVRMADDNLEMLVERAKAGDRTAFSEIVRRLMNQVVALTYRMTGDRESALDLAQDSFITAWQKLHDFRGDAVFTSWLYRIASNKTLNFLKSRGAQPDTFDLEQSPSVVSNQPDPETGLMGDELAADVLKFTTSLPPQQRLVFNLRFYKQMPFAEIALATDRAVGTVKTSYREAIRKLRKHAREKGWDR